MCKEYVNLQTKEKLDWDKVNLLPDNAMLKVKPESWIEWDFEKNEELNIDIWELFKSSNRKVNWICNKCNSEFQSIIHHKIVCNQKCSYCVNKKVNHTNSLHTKRPDLLNEWSYEKNTNTSPHDVHCGSSKKVWWKCLKCNSNYNMKIYDRINGKSCSYCCGKKVNHTNSLRTTHAELVKYWDCHKNSISPDEISKGSHSFVWWKCSKCDESYEMKVYDRVVKDSICPCCKGKRVNKNNSLQTLNPNLASEWHPTKNGSLTTNDVTCGSKKKVWWLGECGHEWCVSVEQRNSKKLKCPICSNKKLLVGYNDMWTTNPELAKLLLNPEDGHMYMKCSGKRTDWKCDKCSNEILNKKISDIYKQRLHCPRCSDGVSFGERIIYQLLQLNSIAFKYDTITTFSGNLRYDFILEEFKIVIEVHGLQHYKDTGFHKLGGKNLIDVINNDILKKNLANENGYEYIELDSSKSDFNIFKEHVINTGLIETLGINPETFNSINMDKTLVLESWKLYEQGYKKIEISNILGVNRNTVAKYLKLKEQTLIN